MRSWAERSFNSQYLQIFLTSVVALNVIPFIGETPIWVPAAAFVFIIWSVLHVFRLVRLPNRPVKWILAFACITGVAVHFRALWGQEPATALLILILSLKLLETARYRDAMYVTFVSYFLLMDYVLISQTLGATIFMVLSVGTITTLLFYLHGDQGSLNLKSLKTVFRTLWLAVPVWIFLFIVFPRFSAALWTLNPKTLANTGFSDELSPGDISELIDSDALAFRATFLSGTTPSFQKMYWRGGVLWRTTNGLKWDRRMYFSGSHITTSKSPAVVHEVVLEPLFNQYIFALDTPTAVSAAGHSQRSILNRPGFVFQRIAPATNRTLYTVRSSTEMTQPPLNEEELDVYLQAPTPSARLEELLIDLKARAQLNAPVRPGSEEVKQSKNAEKLSEAVMNYFLENKFRYTKKPGTTASLDEFLFTKKVGFCEHYAGSYATLMRLLGVPARVVIGFHGGVQNRFAGHWSIRNLDAHAWAEIYVDGEGWQRVDPTQYIAPLRLDLGGDYYVADASQLQTGITREQFESQLHGGLLGRWAFDASAAFDLLSSRWNNFLLRYDFDYQSNLLARLGIKANQRVLLVISLLLGTAVMLVFAYLWLRRAGEKPQPLLKAYRDLCSDLQTKGFPKQPSEGPLHYSARIAQIWPAQAQQVQSIFEEYVSLRYGAAPAQHLQIREWRKRSKELTRTLNRVK